MPCRERTCVNEQKHTLPIVWEDLFTWGYTSLGVFMGKTKCFFSVLCVNGSFDPLFINDVDCSRRAGDAEHAPFRKSTTWLPKRHNFDTNLEHQFSADKPLLFFFLYARLTLFPSKIINVGSQVKKTQLIWGKFLEGWKNTAFYPVFFYPGCIDSPTIVKLRFFCSVLGARRSNLVKTVALSDLNTNCFWKSPSRKF